MASNLRGSFCMGCIRAYMVANTTLIWENVSDGITDEIASYNFGIQWKNYGMTPARRCHSRTSLMVFDGVMPDDFEYTDKAAPTITETNHFGPGQGYNSKVGGLSISDAIAVERGEKHVYVWSWIEYDDIFGRARRRTEVCFHLLFGKDRKTCTPAVSGPLNGADEDCHHQTKT